MPRDVSEDRRPGEKERRYIKRSGAAVVEAKQRVQLQKNKELQKTNTPHLPIFSLSYIHSSRIAVTATQ
jgi:hypothetical protein